MFEKFFFIITQLLTATPATCLWTLLSHNLKKLYRMDLNHRCPCTCCICTTVSILYYSTVQKKVLYYSTVQKNEKFSMKVH